MRIKRRKKIDIDNHFVPKNVGDFLYHFLRPYPIYISFFLFCIILAGIYGSVSTYFTKVIIDLLPKVSATHDLSLLLWPAIFYVLNGEITGWGWRGTEFVRYKICPTIRNNITSFTLDYVHKHNYRYFQDNPSGAVANNINTLADSLEQIWSFQLLFILRGFILLVTALISMYFVHIVFFLALLGWTGFYILFGSLFFKRVKMLSDHYAKNQSVVSGDLVDSLSSAQSVKIFARRVYELSYIQRALNKLAKAYRDKEWFMLKYYWAQTTSITIMLALMLYMLIRYYAVQQVTIGDFALILGLTVFVADNMWWVMEQIDQMNNSIGKCNQSIRAIFSPHEMKDLPGSKILSIEKGRIVFDKVTFKHKEADLLFRNHSVTIDAGQKIGLVGYSGGGKTTFANLILRLYDIDGGEIRIDGQDIKHVSQESLRSAIGMIPQDPVLFHRTLMENIRYGKIEATDAEVISAAKKAHADDFIKDLPLKYESLVGERGIKLSGGQRQRVAIARAFLKNAPILILDEATSQLDSVTETKIQDSLKELMRGKTTIVIAHRLSTLLHMDRIMVFDKGKIIEDGTHKELLAKNGAYKKLWDTQVGGFLPDKEK